MLRFVENLAISELYEEISRFTSYTSESFNGAIAKLNGAIAKHIFFIVQIVKLLTEVLIFIKICKTNFTKFI